MFHIKIVRTSKVSIEKIIIEYNGRKLVFNGRAKICLEKSFDKMEDGSNIFDCQNEFINNVMSTEDKVALFKLYEKAHRICDSSRDVNYKDELSQLKPIIDGIYDVFNVTKFCGFINYSKHLSIPRNLISVTSKGDYPAETTILEDDYVNLVHFIFSVRVIYPILFNLNERLNGVMGADYSLLCIGQNLIRTVPQLTSLRGWDKLNLYIHTTFNKHKIGQRLTETSTGNNAVDKTLYRAIITRLCAAVIPETEKDKHIANVINSACENAKNNFNEAFREKGDSYNGDGEDKRSEQELYQVAEKKNPSKEQAEVEWFTFGLYDENEKPRTVDRFKYQSAALGVDAKLVEMVFDRIPNNWEYNLDNVVLLQLVFMEHLSAYSFYACNYEQLMAAVALGQVKLAQMGYKYLPSVLGSVPDPEGLRTVNPLKLNNEDRDAIEQICAVQAKNTDNRNSNEALLDVQRFLDSYGNGVWRSNLEIGVLDSPDILSCYKPGELYSLELNSAIKVEFVDLVLRMNKI